MLPRISLVLLALAATAVSVAQYGKKAKEPKTPKDPCPKLEKQLKKLSAGILNAEKKFKEKVTTPLEAKKEELKKQDAKMAAGGCSATGEATEACAPIVKEREGVAKAVGKLESASKRMDKRLSAKKAKVEDVNAKLKEMSCIKENQPGPPQAVNGGWGNWTAGACSATCGSGVMTSTRTCDSPVPAHGGAQCAGDANKKTPCQVRSATDAACTPAWGSGGAWYNAAYRKTAVQSSTGWEGPARLAVDGNTNSDYHGGKSCSHTATNRGRQWWRVDLGADHWVGAVKVTNRASGNAARLRDFYVWVSAYPSTNANTDKCVFVSSVRRGGTDTFQCGRTKLGRYVTIALANNFLTLCEVQVMAIRV